MLSKDDKTDVYDTLCRLCRVNSLGYNRAFHVELYNLRPDWFDGTDGFYPPQKLQKPIKNWIWV